LATESASDGDPFHVFSSASISSPVHLAESDRELCCSPPAVNDLQGNAVNRVESVRHRCRMPGGTERDLGNLGAFPHIVPLMMMRRVRI
jgi:hypothetical protein